MEVEIFGIIDDDKVNNFWEWFKSISADLFKNPQNIELLNSLDDLISDLGPFDWEIGPYHSSGSYLAISPNLNEDLYKLTKEIIKKAPSCIGWTFLSAKPAKGWIETWQMLNQNKETIVVDASSWKYKLYKFEDDTYDIDVVSNNVDGDKDTCYLAIDIAITNLLGEENYFRMIRSVNVIEEDEQNSKQLTELRNLGKHIEQIQRNSNW